MVILEGSKRLGAVLERRKQDIHGSLGKKKARDWGQPLKEGNKKLGAVLERRKQELGDSLGKKEARNWG